MIKSGKAIVLFLKINVRGNLRIKRFEVSRSLIQNISLFASLLVFSTLFYFGASGIYKSNTFFNNLSSVNFKNLSLTQSVAAQPEIETTALNFNSADFMTNAGGPGNSTELPESENPTDLDNIVKSSNPDSIPNIWAHLGKINNEFGFRPNVFGGRTYEFHAGIDIDGLYGDTVIAPASGIVTEAGWKGGYGNLIEIDHGNGLKTRYGHLSKILVSVGDSITRGQQIGLIGSTGRSTGPHLHYELRINDVAVNPRLLLPPENQQ